MTLSTWSPQICSLELNDMSSSNFLARRTRLVSFVTCASSGFLVSVLLSPITERGVPSFPLLVYLFVLGFVSKLSRPMGGTLIVFGMPGGPSTLGYREDHAKIGDLLLARISRRVLFGDDSRVYDSGSRSCTKGSSFLS